MIGEGSALLGWFVVSVVACAAYAFWIGWDLRRREVAARVRQERWIDVPGRGVPRLPR